MEILSRLANIEQVSLITLYLLKTLYRLSQDTVTSMDTLSPSLPFNSILHYLLTPSLSLLQDVLLEHQKHVGKVFSQKLSDQSRCEQDLDSSTNTPTDIREIEEKEFGLESKGHFNFPSD